MPTTRLQSKTAEDEINVADAGKGRTTSTTGTKRRKRTHTTTTRKGATTGRRGRGRKVVKKGVEPREEEAEKTMKEGSEAEQAEKGEEEAVSHAGQKREAEGGEEHPKRRGPRGPRRREEVAYKEGTIERGHIYFFYRPKVQIEEVESLEDIRNLNMLLIPRHPESVAPVEAPVKEAQEGVVGKQEQTEQEMKVLPPGADVMPEHEPFDTTKKHYRMITIGKKHLPTEELMKDAGSRKRPVFWATVTGSGDDLEALEKGLGEKTFETTKGTRHDAAARFAARGAYAIVNKEAPHVPSKRGTHFVYCISHPSSESFGDVQHEMGILPAAAFILQVKNPLAPPMGPQQAHTSKKTQYPEELMRDVFGTATGGKGRHDYGLRFASCETPELLDYLGAELLFISAREGRQGVEESIGEERGKALAETEEREQQESIEQVYRELGLDMEAFPAEPLKGEWI
ncbi:hypothetical protein AX15_003754 [Amanita polypyramis BW_CC]|nr:hypothetical protein AX15_003754 [Amanita polypyramis BW_CC]